MSYRSEMNGTTPASYITTMMGVAMRIAATKTVTEFTTSEGLLSSISMFIVFNINVYCLQYQCLLSSISMFIVFNINVYCLQYQCLLSSISMFIVFNINVYCLQYQCLLSSISMFIVFNINVYCLQYQCLLQQNNTDFLIFDLCKKLNT